MARGTAEILERSERKIFWHQKHDFGDGRLVGTIHHKTENCKKSVRQNVIYGWERRGCACDAETLVLIRALHLIEAKLECKIFVEHMRRMLTPEAELADHLTRTSTTTAEDQSKIEHLEWFEVGGLLKEWLANPVVDWELPVKIAKFVK